MYLIAEDAMSVVGVFIYCRGEGYCLYCQSRRLRGQTVCYSDKICDPSIFSGGPFHLNILVKRLGPSIPMVFLQLL